MLSQLYYNSDQTFSRYDAFYNAYNRYVQENYLDVPENMPALEKVVAELHGLYVDTERMLNDPKQGNSARLTICNNVADALKSAYSYRKDIPDSGDADPVEFFLKKKNGGFCVHFASTGSCFCENLEFRRAMSVATKWMLLNLSWILRRWRKAMNVPCRIPIPMHGWKFIWMITDGFRWR